MSSPLQANPGDITLKAGDVLLLDTGAGFRQRYADTPYFALVSEVDNSNPPRWAYQRWAAFDWLEVA